MKKTFIAIVMAFAFFVPNVNGTVQAEVSSQTHKLIVEDSKTERDLVLKAGGKITYSFKNIDAIEVEIPVSDVSSFYQSRNVLQTEQPIIFYGQRLDYGIGKVEAPKAWSNGYTGKGVKVAIIDSGVVEHEDLKIAEKIKFDVNDEDDYYYHGTHVAGIINAQDNNKGTKGVASGASLYSLQITSFGDIAKAIDWSIAHQMDVINMSFGYQFEDGVIKHLIDRANDAGIIVVASAGNEGNAAGEGESVNYPAKYENVVSVGATNPLNSKPPFSSTGKVDVSAPGFNVLSTFRSYEGNAYMYMSGTSMSSPYVAGIFALYKQAYPNYTNSQLRALLYRNAKDLGVTGKDPLYGYGIAQAPFHQFIPTFPVTQVPSNFKLFSQNGYEVTLSWEPTIDATSYVVLRDGVKVYEGKSNTFSDAKVQYGSYTYTLIAKGSKGSSLPTDLVVNVNKLNGLPMQIEDINVNAGVNQVHLRWSPSYHSDKYVLTRNGVKLYEGTSREFVDKGLQPGHEYIYTLYAQNQIGTTDPYTFFVYTQMPRLTSKPTGLKATSIKDNLKLTWNKMKWAEFYVIKKDNGEELWLDSPEFIDLKFNDGKTHTYVVRAGNSSGLSPAASITVKPKATKTFTSISLNRTTFKTGETIQITSVIRDERKTVVTDAQVTVSIINEKGKVIYSKKMKTDKNGKVQTSFKFLTKHAKGVYQVKVKTTHSTLQGSTGTVTVHIK